MQVRRGDRQMVEMITKTQGEMESKECRVGDKCRSERGTAGGKGRGKRKIRDGIGRRAN